MRFIAAFLLLAAIVTPSANARPTTPLTFDQYQFYFYGDNTDGCARTPYDWVTRNGIGDLAAGASATTTVCAIENEGFARPVYISTYSTSNQLRVVANIGEDPAVVIPVHAEGHGHYGYNLDVYLGGYPGATEREDVTLTVTNLGKNAKNVSGGVFIDRIY